MSTEPNLRMLFDQYHGGFDNYPAWVDHHKSLHAKHPLDCAEFGAEWLWRWSEVGRLLESTVRFEALMDDGEWLDMGADARLMDWFDSPRPFGQPTPERLVLLGDTIVREWPAKDEYDDIF